MPPGGVSDETGGISGEAGGKESPRHTLRSLPQEILRLRPNCIGTPLRMTGLCLPSVVQLFYWKLAVTEWNHLSINHYHIAPRVNGHEVEATRLDINSLNAKDFFCTTIHKACHSECNEESPRHTLRSLPQESLRLPSIAQDDRPFLSSISESFRMDRMILYISALSRLNIALFPGTYEQRYE